MRTIAYNEVAVPWSRSDHLMGTRLLHSRDDSNIFSGILLRTLKLRQWSTRTHLWLELFMNTFVPDPSSCLHPEDDWRWAECLLCLFLWHVLSHAINLSLPSPCQRHGSWGRKLDLAYGTSGVWALGPKLRFHTYWKDHQDHQEWQTLTLREWRWGDEMVWELVEQPIYLITTYLL
jgi:hypothetical protein